MRTKEVIEAEYYTVRNSGNIPGEDFINRVFLSLWDKATHQPDYEKKEWQTLQMIIERLIARNGR